MRGRKGGSRKGHREVELDMDFKSQVFWLEPDWSHGMEKGHRGGESRSEGLGEGLGELRSRGSCGVQSLCEERKK